MIVPAPAAAAAAERRPRSAGALRPGGVRGPRGGRRRRSADGADADGIVQCEVVDVLPSRLDTSIVAPFREAGRNLRFYKAHRLRVVSQPKQGVAQNLITTTRNDLWVTRPPVRSSPEIFATTARWTARPDGSRSRRPSAASHRRRPGAAVPRGDLGGPRGGDRLALLLHQRRAASASVLPAALNWWRIANTGSPCRPGTPTSG